MIKKICLTLTIALGTLAFASAASAADPVLPVESKLSVEPGTISWPSAPEFEYRLRLKSGPEGADFSFNFPNESWGPEDVDGTPFRQGEATLEGPGALKVESIMVGDPSPTACVRGGFGFGLTSYRLAMDPNSETIVTMPSALIAAPVSGMSRRVSAEIGISLFDSEAIVLTAPIAIDGREDVRIIGKIPGSEPHGITNLRPGENFRIAGRTVPALVNRVLRFHAEQRTGFAQRLSPPRVLTTVRTDAKGRFRTSSVAIRKAGTWVLTSRVKGATEESSSCNGAVEIGRDVERATVQNLDGRQFVSTSIKGPGKKPKKIRIAFYRDTIYDTKLEVIRENGPNVSVNAGCNNMGGGYEIRKGRLRWFEPVFHTQMLCEDDRDNWIDSRLRSGLYASYVGKTLVLKGKRGVRIKLKLRH